MDIAAALQSWPDPWAAVERSIDGNARLTLISGGLSALHVLLWIVFWRKHPERAATFRGLWLVLMAVVWGVTALLGAKVVGSTYPRIPPAKVTYLLGHPFPAGLIATACLVWGVVVLRGAGHLRGSSGVSSGTASGPS